MPIVLQGERSPVIRVERKQGLTQVTCALERLTCHNVEALHRILRRCIRQADPTIVVDLATARYVDTTVLAVLIDIKVRIAARQVDTTLIVVGSPAYRRLVHVCRLETVLPVCSG